MNPGSPTLKSPDAGDEELSDLKIAFIAFHTGETAEQIRHRHRRLVEEEAMARATHQGGPEKSEGS